MPWINIVPQPRGTLTAQAQPRQPRDWYRISNATEDEAEILVYDEIGGWFGGGAEDFVRELRDVRASRLTVRVNSPGGSVFDGVTMANALRAHPATVTVQVDGIAASIASVIALAGDRLVMMPQSQLMIHDASGLSIGNAQDMREMADLLDRQSDNIAEAYADKAGGTVEDWRALMRAETWYSAREAVDAGLADELVTLPARQPEEEPDPAMRNEWDLSVFRYAGRQQAPQPPAPTPSAAPEQPAAGLESDVASILGADVVAALRALVTPQPAAEPADPAAPEAEPSAPEAQLQADGNPGDAETAADPDGGEPAAVAEPETEPAPAEPDEWARSTAHLTQPSEEDWAALVAHLTAPDPEPLALSSGAATA